MNKQDKNSRKVPELRFLEFEEEWYEKSLGDLIKYTKGFAFKSGDYMDSGIRIIRASDLGTNFIKNNNSKIYISLEKVDQYKKYRILKGNIIITTVGSHPDLKESAVGRGIFITKDNEGLLNQNMLKIELNNKINTYFLFSYINSARYIEHIKAIKRGNANQANITVLDLLRYTLYCTSLSEQEKIADFFTAVDEKITLLQQRIDLLKEYKKGILQGIFSKRLRFKDRAEHDYSDWKIYKIEDIFTLTRGSVLAVPQTKRTPSDDYIYPVYSSQTGNNGLMGFYNKYLYENAITWTTDGANAGDVKYRDGKFYCTNVCGVLINLNGFANAMSSEAIARTAHKYVSYVGNPKLMNNVMAKIKIEIPSDVNEQQEIADFLISLDNLIDLEQSKLTQTKKFKKALLKKMFI
jgi:type I restriction enzyme, S subunit